MLQRSVARIFRQSVRTLKRHLITLQLLNLPYNRWIFSENNEESKRVGEGKHLALSD